ncbi:uncharacterized protein LOC131024880 [Salvia miltiorrhiza]|uniref:uncharacterized protein LOC131024880 n=1 Tax=Salvia miltiorrhiza TaxID=226208 RepID=UPI0025AB7A8E|nr:uncharacterized protein LOC131024880 [Salvia miltiorrhiza]XP_057810415.1 uncharacterized protein LOC131024880 [Salvia miltiorrhiza]
MVPPVYYPRHAVNRHKIAIVVLAPAALGSHLRRHKFEGTDAAMYSILLIQLLCHQAHTTQPLYKERSTKSELHDQRQASKAEGPNSLNKESVLMSNYPQMLLCLIHHVYYPKIRIKEASSTSYQKVQVLKHKMH